LFSKLVFENELLLPQVCGSLAEYIPEIRNSSNPVGDSTVVKMLAIK
jgi:hypothetical protein